MFEQSTWAEGQCLKFPETIGTIHSVYTDQLSRFYVGLFINENVLTSNETMDITFLSLLTMFYFDSFWFYRLINYCSWILIG